MRSMTGFVSSTTSITRSDNRTSQATITLKSLNSRYFEATCKLPYQLHILETELTKRCKHTLHRGHLYLTIYMSNPTLLKGDIKPSLPVIEQYINATEQIGKKFNFKDQLSLHTLLTLPHIFVEHEELPDDNIKQQIFNEVDRMLNELVKQQEAEGAHLEQDIRNRLSCITAEIDQIEKASSATVHAQKNKVQQVMTELEYDESQFAVTQKNALFAMLDKIDIHEEVTRFKSHLAAINAQLERSSIEKGKRLDFTIQELGREINTITAKCSDADISRLGINIKVELEKMREQIQNIV